MFGVGTNYDENIYTTAIDRSHPEYKLRAEKAARIAREIESGSAMNAHVAEERGALPVDDSGMDEEDKYVPYPFSLRDFANIFHRYSGVRRGGDFPPLPTGQPNKYTPPARRNQAPPPAVPAPPADPAIISVQATHPAPAPIAPTPAQSTTSTTPTVALTETSASAKSEESATPAAATKPTTDATKPVADSKQAESTASGSAKPASQKANGSSNTATVIKATMARNGGENAAATVERDVLNDFKQFKANEKLKMQERHRQQSKANREVKINDLKKFAQNFKLNTPVPTDLVPILAKDKEKQDEIIEKARKQFEDAKTTPTKPSPTPIAQTESKAQRPAPPRFDNGQSSPSGLPDRQNMQRGRSGQGAFTQQPGRTDRNAPAQTIPTIPPHRGQALPLGTRLTMNQQAHRQNTAQPQINQPPLAEIRIPSQGAVTPSNGLASPTSSVSTRFNAAATEFRPNVGAKSFQPTASASHTPSPRRESAPRIESKKLPVIFWGEKKRSPRADRPDFKNSFNPIKRMKKELEQEKSNKFFYNQGIPPAYHTPPTWDPPKDNTDKTHVDLLGKGQIAGTSISPGHQNMNNGSIPHLNQLPLHLQGSNNGPINQNPNQTPRHVPIQPHQPHGGHHPYNDHSMHFNPPHSVQPSPRPMQATYVPYSAQAPPVQMYQQGFQGYGMPANGPIAIRHVSGTGPQYIGPQGQVIGGQVMSHSPSSGPYMPPMNPQMPMFTPTQSHVYPHGGPFPPQPGPNGYGSPGPRIQAPMMSHQGSQQGHAPQQVVYMQQGVNHSPAMFAPNPAAPSKQSNQSLYLCFI